MEHGLNVKGTQLYKSRALENFALFGTEKERLSKSLSISWYYETPISKIERALWLTSLASRIDVTFRDITHASLARPKLHPGSPYECLELLHNGCGP
jgi:hypothetical protein